MAKTLIIGAQGQLGQCLKIVADRQSFDELIFPDEKTANILDRPGLEQLFKEHLPQYVINCAAYTAVDKAESDVSAARRVNKDGTENLAILCEKYHAIFIHISTDFVFEGNVVKLLTENDETKPLSVYGLTKLEGEQEITSILAEYYILRTSWLYSECGNNFVKTMLKLGKEKDELRIIADQFGTPTYAIDLAGVILHIIKSGSETYGIYHYSNEGMTSWFDFAKSIFDMAEIDINVYPIPTNEYPTPAVRPKFSVMDKSKIKNTFNLTIPYWRDSLEICIKILSQ